MSLLLSPIATQICVRDMIFFVTLYVLVQEYSFDGEFCVHHNSCAWIQQPYNIMYTDYHFSLVGEATQTSCTLKVNEN